MVAARGHGAVKGGITLVDDDVLDGRRGLDGSVGGFLEREEFAASPSAVRGNDGLAFGVIDAIGKRICGETSEDDAVDRADACTSEHGDGGFGDHGHVDGDAIAFGDAK